MSDVYERLAKYLDNLPAGYPATDSGVELRILKRWFTPEEAEVAMGLSMMPEPVSSISERLNMDESSMAQILESMSKKGLIMRSSKGAQKLYSAAMFAIGIWEYQVNKLDVGLVRDFNEYIPHFLEKTVKKQKTQQLRVIPVSKSISAEISIMPYEEAETLIKKQSKIVVADCICRKTHRMLGEGCEKPLETCLTFGSAAYYYEENGLGRSIPQEEALEILNMGLEAGLVLQPGNAQKTWVICMCCGCCCDVLKNIKKWDKPAKYVNTSYYAAVNEEDCTACETCMDRCQMDAITVDDIAHVDTDRCIGCGLCVVKCETDAISLVGKSEAERWIPPANIVETYMKIAQERGKM
jgi:electron transport complex protein RnfB